jgi:hypothetical protein
MPLLTRNAVLLAKIETTKGTDSVPTPAANAIAIRSMTLTPINQETVDRALIRPWMGLSEQIPVGEFAQIEFEVEFAGAGTSAITAAKWSDLVRACGFSATVNGIIDHRHDPITTAIPGLTLYAVVGNQVLHKITGAVGTWSLAMNAAGLATLSFRFIGAYVAPTDAVQTGVVYTGWQTPLGLRNTNVPVLTLHGALKTATPIRSMSIDLNNELIFRNLIGSSTFEIVDRAPTGQIELSAEPIATQNWYTPITGVTLAAMTATIGSVAFNIAEVTAPRVQLLNPRIGAVDSFDFITMDMRFVPGATGNDEIRLLTR